MTPPRSPQSTAGRAALAPALQSRNFRLFWLAQLFSTIGTSFQVVAEGYLIYQITQSTFWLGAVTFIGLLPVIPISLLGGVLIDRVPRRKLLQATQLGLLLQATLFGVLALSGTLGLAHLIILYFLFGALIAVDHPARRAFLVDLVDRRDLANAVALNATLFNVSNLVGYAAAGLLIGAFGAGSTILLNAATYLAPIAALAAIRVPDTGHDQERPSLGIALSEGLRVLWRQPTLLAAILLMAVVGGLAYPVYGLMPAFAEEVVGTGPLGLGFLLAAGALGSLAGSAVIARLADRRGMALAAVALLLPLLMFGFASSRTLAVAILWLVPLGLALLLLQSLVVTLVQLRVADRVRGRVMTLFSQVHAGSDIGGNLLVGTLAVPLGLPLALSLAAVGALLGAVLFWLLAPNIRQSA